MSTEAAQETVAVAMTATSPPHTRQLSATCAAAKRETATVAVSMATTTSAECCDEDCRAAVVAGTMAPVDVDRGRAGEVDMMPKRGKLMVRIFLFLDFCHFYCS